METLKNLYFKHKEIINYLLFGGMTTVVSWGTYSLFVKAAVLFAFVTNKLFVFESKTWQPATALREFVSFIGARLATGVIEWFGVPYFSTHGLTHPLFGVKGLLAKVVVSIVVIILNYIFSKFLVFIKKDKPEN